MVCRQYSSSKHASLDRADPGWTRSPCNRPIESALCFQSQDVRSQDEGKDSCLDTDKVAHHQDFRNTCSHIYLPLWMSQPWCHLDIAFDGGSLWCQSCGCSAESVWWSTCCLCYHRDNAVVNRSSPCIQNWLIIWKLDANGQGRTAGCWRLADDADLRWKKPRGDSKVFLVVVKRHTRYYNRAIEHSILLNICQPVQYPQFQCLDDPTQLLSSLARSFPDSKTLRLAMDIIRRALAAPPRRRQVGMHSQVHEDPLITATSSFSEGTERACCWVNDIEITASETSASSSSAAAATGSAAAVTQKGTAAAKTTVDAAATTSSPSLSGAVESTAEGPNGPTTIFHIATPPQFTATSKEAYIAPGVNATHPFTSTPPPTAAASTAAATTSTSTSSHYVDPAEEAKASAKAFGIPKNELTRCEINGTEADNGPFCTPKHLQNMWVGFTYASRLPTHLLPMWTCRYTNPVTSNLECRPLRRECHQHDATGLQRHLTGHRVDLTCGPELPRLRQRRILQGLVEGGFRQRLWLGSKYDLEHGLQTSRRPGTKRHRSTGCACYWPT